MHIHRSIATCFEEPCVDMRLDTVARFLAQSHKGLLNAVLRQIPIATQQFVCIANERALQSFENRLQPNGMAYFAKLDWTASQRILVVRAVQVALEGAGIECRHAVNASGERFLVFFGGISKDPFIVRRAIPSQSKQKAESNFLSKGQLGLAAWSEITTIQSHVRVYAFAKPRARRST
jgi:hypothetical protein